MFCMREKLIRHDIRLPEWADVMVRSKSKELGIMQATLLRSWILERLEKEK